MIEFNLKINKWKKGINVLSLFDVVLFGIDCGISIYLRMEKTIEMFDNKYTVSSDGNVYSLKGIKKMLVGKIATSGYREVVINHLGKKNYLLVHRLVASTFLPNPNGYRTVNHKDGNKTNNDVANLEWSSDSDNLIHARNNGLLNTKINNEIAEQIKKRHRNYS